MPKKTLKNQKQNLLILGPPKSGKSEYILDEAVRLHRERGPEEHIYLLVPDQFTLEYEQLLAKRLGGLLMFVEVGNIRNFARDMLASLGVEPERIGMTGRNIIMESILRENRDSLLFFNRRNFKPSFIGELTRFVDNMDAPIDLSKAGDEAGEILKQKVEDINLIYDIYSKTLKDREFLSNHMLLKMAAERAGDSERVKKSYFLINDYDAFSVSQMEFFDELSRHSLGLQIAINFEDGNPIYRYIDPLVDGIRKLGLKELYFPNDKYPGTLNPDMVKISDSIFNQDSSLLDSCLDRVDAYSAETRYEEVSLVATKIHELLYPEEVSDRAEGSEPSKASEFAAGSEQSEASEFAAGSEPMEPSEIAVFCSNLDVYRGLVEQLFPKYGIPYFVDSKKNFESSPLGVFLDGLIDYFINPGNQDAVIKMLMSGLFPINDSYILKCRVTAREADDYVEESAYFGESTGAAKKYIPFYFAKHALKQTLKNFKLDIEGAKTEDGVLKFELSQFVRALYDFLTREFTVSHINNKFAPSTNTIKDKCISHSWKAQIISGEASYERDYGARIWDSFMRVLEELDSISELMGMQSFKDVKRIFKLSLSMIPINRIPEYKDYIMVIPVDRARNISVRHSFVLGSLRGELPANISSGYLFNMEEQNAINIATNLAFNTRNNTEYSAYTLHLLLTSPTDRFTFTYPKTGGSYSRIISIMEEASNKSDLGFRVKKAEDFVRGIEGGPVQQVMGSAFSLADGFGDLNAKFNIEGFEPYAAIKTDNTEAEPEYDLSLSPTAINSYLECPFKYFVYNMLRPRELVIKGYSASNFGTILHRILEEFIRKEFGEDPKARSKELFEEAKKSSAKEYIKSIRGEIKEKIESIIDGLRLDDFAKYAADFRDEKLMKKQYLEICQTAAEAVMYQFVSGNFYPWQMEATIKQLIEVDGGKKVLFVGKADRIDVSREEDAFNRPDYFRIIDYKTGKDEFSIADVKSGNSLQLPLYAFSLMRSREFKESKCAGMYLFKTRDITDIDDKLKDIEGLEIFETLPLKGISLKGNNVMELQDSSDAKTLPDSVIEGLYTVNDEDLERSQDKAKNLYRWSKDSGGSSDFTAYFFDLMNSTLEYFDKVALNVLGGNFVPSPDSKACKYCKYRAICCLSDMDDDDSDKEDEDNE